MFFVLLLILPGLKAEQSTLSTLIASTTFRNLPFDTVKFLKDVKPTKKGPVLFPNDGPTPPPTPLIVTSRPLIESIRRSELNPNNTRSNQASKGSFSPIYLDPGKVTTPQYYTVTTAPNYDYFRVPADEVPIKNAVETTDFDHERAASHRPAINRGSTEGFSTQHTAKLTVVDVTYPTNYIHKDTSSDYSNNYQNKYINSIPTYYTQQKSTLPPIYRAFSEHANKVLSDHKSSTLHAKPVYEYQSNTPYYNDYHTITGVGNNDKYLDSAEDHDHGDNYAFSYTVRDHKTGDDFSHKQSSSGSATNGEYRVRLPDGRMQIVSYTADERGYKADVRYDDVEESGETSGPITHRNHATDNGYQNNHYTTNGKITTNNNNHVSNFGDVSGTLYVDYLNKKPITDINKDKPLGKLLANKSKVYQNDHFPYNDGNFEDNYNDKLNLFDLNDYEQYDGKDYSSESVNYQPYRSKFTPFFDNSEINKAKSVKSTVVPPYEVLKGLFVTRNPIFALSDPQESGVDTQESITNTRTSVVNARQVPNTRLSNKRVVIIDKKKPLYTDVNRFVNEFAVTPSPAYLTTTPTAPTTTVSSPSHYLYSTITNLKNKLNLSARPVLSQEYLNKINRYLDLKF